MSDLHSMTEPNRMKKTIDVIEPNTTRVLQMRRIKQEQERQLAKKRQLENNKRQEQRRKLQKMEKARKDQEQEQHTKMLEEERRRMEEQQQSTRLVGKFGHMINDLNSNTTNLQFTISGLDLRPTQVKVLLSNVQNNSSLKGLTMCRKKLTDVEGRQISERLSSNAYLERLQLQGNQLGPQTLKALAQLLKINETIRLLDLQGNQIMEKGIDEQFQKAKLNHQEQKIGKQTGLYKLVEALKQNQTILSINLNNTGLGKFASKLLRQLMEQNTTIILLDIQNNPNMALQDVLAIQDQLVKNKQEHDDERYMQFIQRKRMRRQQDISGVLLLNKQTKKLRTQAIQLNIKTKKQQLDQQWQQFLQKQQLARQKQIIKMQKQAGAKKGKKKKK